MHKKKSKRILNLILFGSLTIALIIVAMFVYQHFLKLNKVEKLNNVDQTEWYLILVNSQNKIPEDYEVELTELKNDKYVDSRIYPDLQNMFNDARAEGIYPEVTSGYRTTEKQQSLMDQKIDAYKAEGYSDSEAEELASQWVAEPGTSEHQLGLALDINADNTGKSTNQDVYDWLYNNAYKYGFILRYPSDKTDITGTSYEPWHYRYVGKDAAEEIYTSRLCLEEYLRNK